MPTNTTNYSFNKPNVNSADDEDLWGDQLNDNWDSIDTLLKTATNLATSAKTGTYTVTTSDRNKLILADASGGAFTITLPPAATVGDGFKVGFKKIDSDTAEAVTIDGDSTETIDGETSIALSLQYETLLIVSDGTEWHRTVYIPESSETKSGTVEKATQAEAEAETAGKNITADNAKHLPGMPVAYVRFDGTATSGTADIDKSMNVDSVTVNAQGDFTINFTNNMADTDYVFVDMVGGTASGGESAVPSLLTPPAVDSFRISVTNTGGSLAQARYVNIVIWGELA